MFEELSERLGRVLKDLRGHGRLSEANIEAAIREVRLALLEADVNYAVVKEFIVRVKKKALGEEVLLSLTPGQQFTKIVKDELTETLGGAAAGLELKGSPAVIMLVGLNGSGKTTTTAKLAGVLKDSGRNPFIVPADLARPAAILQLKRLSEDLRVDCFDVVEGVGDGGDPRQVCIEALKVARIKGYDTVLVDTAGRLHVEKDLMEELGDLKRILGPGEVLFVADAMTGQDAVNTAVSFDRDVGITGILLTKLDGDARGGGALSMRMTTGKPIKFAGVGEKLDALEVFHPERLAGRILGMGDVVGLVEKAHQAIDQKRAEELERKIRKDSFTLQDFKDQLQQIKRLGSLEGILSMIPGFDEVKRVKGLKVDEKELVRVEAMINSMTIEERVNPAILNARRRIRIARGSGTRVQDVNRLIKQYSQMRQMMKKLKKAGGIGGMNLRGLFQA
jgi:signal recognition particle subunit SRP54